MGTARFRVPPASQGLSPTLPARSENLETGVLSEARRAGIWLQAPELNRVFRGYEPRDLPFVLPAKLAHTPEPPFNPAGPPVPGVSAIRLADVLGSC